MIDQIKANAIQAVPALGLVSATASGHTLPEWAAIAGICFIVLQAARLLWVWAQEIRGKR